MNTKRTGDKTELECIAYLFGLGFDIAIPYGENTRYDFILDNGKDLLKIQCKTCQVFEDKIVIPCHSIRSNRTRNRTVKYNSDEIDYFATYFNNKCYLININENKSNITLRFKPTKNNQMSYISNLLDYEAGKVLKDYMLP